MSNLIERQYFGPSCPSGGTWYACASGSRFVGCCTNDPCADGCAQENVRAGSFDPAQYGNIPASSCPGGAAFYTCRDTDPPFMGCCKSDPCASGCAQANLAPGYLERPAQFSAYSATGAPTTAITSSTTSSPTSSSTGSAIVVTVSATPGKNHTAAIVGGTLGAVVILLILVGVLIFFVRRKKRSRTHTHNNEKSAPPTYYSPDTAYSPHFLYDPPQTYAHELATPEQSNLHKPNNRLSELSAETRRSELESPGLSPNLNIARSPVSEEYVVHETKDSTPHLGGSR